MKSSLKRKYVNRRVKLRKTRKAKAFKKRKTKINKKRTQRKHKGGSNLTATMTATPPLFRNERFVPGLLNGTTMKPPINTNTLSNSNSDLDFVVWRTLLNENLKNLLLTYSQLKLELQFLKLPKYISEEEKSKIEVKFVIEVFVKEISLNDNLEIKISRSYKIIDYEPSNSDPIKEKYCKDQITEWDNFDLKEISENGYYIYLFDTNPNVYSGYTILYTILTQALQQTYYDVWKNPVNNLIFDSYYTGKSSSIYFKIISNNPVIEPVIDFRSDGGLRTGYEKGTAKTHIVCNYQSKTLTIYHMMKYIAENPVYFNRGKIILAFYRIDNYLDDSDAYRMYDGKYDWQEYLDFFGYAARGDIVFYNKSMGLNPHYNLEMTYNNKKLQYDIDNLIDYFKANNYNGQSLDTYISKKSNNLAYNKRLSKSIFYSLIEKDTSTLEGIRDDYRDYEDKLPVIDKIIDKKISSTKDLTTEKKNICSKKTKQDYKMCIKDKWGLDINDLCKKSYSDRVQEQYDILKTEDAAAAATGMPLNNIRKHTDKYKLTETDITKFYYSSIPNKTEKSKYLFTENKNILPRSLMYGTQEKLENNFYYISREEDYKNLCS